MELVSKTNKTYYINRKINKNKKLDIPVYDILPSLNRNTLLALGTIMNVQTWLEVFTSLAKGLNGSMKEIFFDAYYRDEEQQAIAKEVLKNI